MAYEGSQHRRVLEWMWGDNCDAVSTGAAANEGLGFELY